MQHVLNIKVNPIKECIDPYMLDEESIHLAAYYYSIHSFCYVFLVSFREVKALKSKYERMVKYIL